MRVNTEVTELDYENTTRIEVVSVPAIRVRKSETTVELPSGAVMMTAGLIQQTSNQAINGLPGRHDVMCRPSKAAPAMIRPGRFREGRMGGRDDPASRLAQ